MTANHKDSIVKKLTALTDGPTPLLHVVRQVGDIICVHVQPWGPPVYLNWEQAEMFARDLPLEMPATRKAAGSEAGRHKRRKHG